MPAYVLCASVGVFADDVHATCAECGASIVHRPYVPADSITLCIPCGLIWLRRNDHAELRVTDEQLRELSLYLQRTRGVQ